MDFLSSIFCTIPTKSVTNIENIKKILMQISLKTNCENFALWHENNLISCSETLYFFRIY